ncbi:MAG: Hsp20/alpha crystallin family protein [Lentisphaerae bacterium]|nr:Hsp20/alpha crystallin family protein [Lentisphaerota bacterium]
MLGPLKRHALLPATRRWDTMFDTVMGKFDLFPGEELRSELEDTLHPDIELTDKAVTIHLAMPGFTRKDITVEIENDMLHIRGERNCEVPCSGKSKKILRSERIHNEYSQSLRLPGNIQSQQATAVCADGVLTVSIPRENCNCNQLRKIEVK